MCSITTTLPNSDIDINIEYEVRGDHVIYSAAYLGDQELPAKQLTFTDALGNSVKLADYFNFCLQDKASQILMWEHA